MGTNTEKANTTNPKKLKSVTSLRPSNSVKPKLNFTVVSKEEIEKNRISAYQYAF
jgi:hypothetical protein